MPGTKISDYQLGDSGSVKWNNFLTTIEKQRKGFIALSLTNYGNNSEPAIEAGSYVEISGALYGFTSEESINGTPSSGNTNYIYIDTSDLKPYWTTTAPTWSADKNGWYDSTETDRYIGGCYYDGTNYTGKWAYSNIRNTDDLPEGSTNKYFNGKTLDDLPDGSNYVRLSKSAQTIYGAKTFNSIITDNESKVIKSSIVYENVVSSIGSFTISGLNIVNDGGFYRLLLSYHGTGTSSGGGYVTLRFNGDSSSNYVYARIYLSTNATSGQPTFTRYNNKNKGAIAMTQAGDYFDVDCLVSLPYGGGLITWTSRGGDSNKGSGDDIGFYHYHGTLNVTKTNITSITIISEPAGAWACAIENVRIRLLRYIY